MSLIRRENLSGLDNSQRNDDSYDSKSHYRQHYDCEKLHILIQGFAIFVQREDRGGAFE